MPRALDKTLDTEMAKDCTFALCVFVNIIWKRTECQFQFDCIDGTK